VGAPPIRPLVAACRKPLTSGPRGLRRQAGRSRGGLAGKRADQPVLQQRAHRGGADDRADLAGRVEYARGRAGYPRVDVAHGHRGHLRERAAHAEAGHDQRGREPGWATTRSPAPDGPELCSAGHSRGIPARDDASSFVSFSDLCLCSGPLMARAGTLARRGAPLRHRNILGQKGCADDSCRSQGIIRLGTEKTHRI
jgi:hypothetical protein